MMAILLTLGGIGLFALMMVGVRIILLEAEDHETGMDWVKEEENDEYGSN